LVERLQTVIERIPSSTRRIIITLILLALLAFLFPLSDDDRHNGLLTDDGAIPTAETSPLPIETASGESGTQQTRTPRATPTVGLTRTLQPTPTACVIPDDWEIYVVRSGDTLDGIARLVGISLEELVAANCLRDPNRIDVRQQIWVPELPSPFITATPTPTNTPTPTITPTSTLSR
jgi:LysM repeat protein